MVSSLTSASLAVLFLWSGAVRSQTTHLVTVGTSGSFYDPPTVSAQKGDIVRFLFTSSDHTVTQSTYENPCIPLPGGFNSGLIGPAINTSANLLSWDLVVADDTQPIWYFCQGVSPASHCAAGMAGVINPPSIALWDNFISAAKAVSGTPSPTPALFLTGVGAYATSPPVAVLSLSATPSSDVSAISSLSIMFATSTSSSPTPTPQPASKTPVGPIVGGAVGGVAAVIIITVLAILLYRAKRSARRDVPDGDESTQIRQKEPQTGIYSSELTPNRPQPERLQQGHFVQPDPYRPQRIPPRNNQLSSELPRQLPRPPYEYSPLAPQPSIRDIAHEVVALLKNDGSVLPRTSQAPETVPSTASPNIFAGYATRSSLEHTESLDARNRRVASPVSATYPPRYEA
ncbi:hypothetical protein NEOLEDRAFT_1178781 [Neolentinus lepideus HHB14362 ss-1]|uniref:Cupredoxin n=1 Tax=Neolentinus lepideus HHB14362 ss-1 TaxID=1314782 RepID=A0A165SE81_9AGAM|nr:hypothetical protein NEOLEDRAFT_1178781 [Neolentinus lepideus HHB14362 ss-1]